MLSWEAKGRSQVVSACGSVEKQQGEEGGGTERSVELPWSKKEQMRNREKIQKGRLGVGVSAHSHRQQRPLCSSTGITTSNLDLSKVA